MRKLITSFIAVILLCVPQLTMAKATHLLPKPQKIEVTSGTPFALGRTVTITDPTNSSLLEEFFTGNGCTIADGGAEVTVTLASSIDGAYDYTLYGYDNEAYTLSVTADAISITAVTKTGVIRAAQTLAQLAEGYDSTAEIETVEITDWPAFKLRGYMHDVGRSFVEFETLKKHIDLLSRFKVNTFHWHMTENQAWRFEVKAYPQLTSSASMTRFVGKYYTQEQCKELQDYAAERGVIVIPEIDMPGHSEAFARAMGYDMQTDNGVAALQTILEEVAAVFDKAPYIHIGADEKTITYSNFLKIMTDKVHSLGKKVVVWNPINGVTITTSTGADMTQMWSSRGAVINGMPNIDCRYNYTNHFDVFADLVGIYKSNIYYEQKGNSNVAGTISAPWNDRKTPTEEDIIKQNNFFANVLASAERAWIGGGKQYIETGGTTLPNSGDEFEEFADWERRFLFHKANSLKEEPIPYVKQTNVRWRITEPFPNGGDMNASFAPETEGLKNSYTVNGTTYSTGIATGAGIYLRHTWGNNTVPTYYGSTNYSNSTAYAWTYVYSETEQTAGAQIEFQNYGRSEKDTAPEAGKWDRKGSRIWLNDTEILPPAWDNTGVSINNEVDLKNENFTARKPVEVTLKQGWNKVFIKLPYVAANGVRLNKWMFTFVLTDTEGKDALEGVVYSPNKTLDEAADQLAATIEEAKNYVADNTSDTLGYYSPSLADELNTVIARIEATLGQVMTSEERAQQTEELNAAFDAFKASLATAQVNQPKSDRYYTMKTPLRDNRYAASNGANADMTGVANITDAAKWKFVTRTDGKFDIVNYANNTYVSPASSNNTALKTQSAGPAAGWELKAADEAGYFIIVSGNVQFNQTNSGLSYKIYNWGDGTNTTDTGCKYLIEETEVNETGGGEATDVDYTPGFTGTRTNSARGINSITLASTSYPDHAANSLSIGTSEFSQCYVDKSDVTMKAGAGDVVTITTGIAGSWMNSYVYIDRDKNGFTAGIAADGFTPTDDLVSYSFYNNGASSDENGKNSAGATITGNSRSTVSLPQFTVPAEPGTYRMRVKLDWCNIDPNGDQDGKFGDFMANGGHIIDVTLEVAEAQEGVVSQIFNPTTIVDGDFAQGTVWYTLQIAANGFVIDNNSTDSYIALDEYMSDATNDAQLWAFVGDNTNGYRLYNKEAGATMVLAAPTAMTGTTGSTSYPKLVDAANIPNGYTDLWLFTPSSDLGEGDTYYYMYEKGYPSNKVNNRDNKLAFWNSGADAGSTVNVRFAQAEYAINTTAGSWTASNAAGTWASAWKSTAVPHISLAESQGRNNMAAYNTDGDIQMFTCLEAAAVNGVYTATYNISADEGYFIAGYRFNFKSSGANDVTVTPTGQAGVTANQATAQNVTVTGSEENSLSFTVTSSSNMFANAADFHATIVRSAAEIEPSQEIFVTNPGNIPYRIPAIATASNGNIIAVADYRHSGADIGMVHNGRIDLHARISQDNGATWGEKFAIVEGLGANSPDFMHVGFGDPCIVADRESNRVLVLSCAGNVSFPSGTRNNHQNIARFYSEDNGVTWSEPVDIAETIYSKWDSSTQGPVMAMFIGSGKIHQSRYVKVNSYYRLYCAVLLKNKNATYTNFVLYSDNFGDSWEVLGGVDTAPIPDGADEPKVEELPNGNVVVSSRCNGGRHFNIFTFTDAETAQGSWGTRATSNSSVNGVVALGNSTNGEIMIFPAIRNEDNAETWIALQSLPFGSGRANVGIYYKELESESDYDTPANFAKDWDGRHQASFIGSAYSTMCFQKDSTIAFLYEEETHGAGYTIVYKNYTLEDITDGAYSIQADDTETGIDEIFDEVKGETGKIKGVYDLTGRKVEIPTKGIYIIDGKKTLIK